MLNGITVYKQICDYSTAPFPSHQDQRRRTILLVVVPLFELTDTR